MKTTLIVQNLKCGGCANTITKKLTALENITEVAVDKDTSEITFSYIQEDDVKVVTDKLKQIGYPTEDAENSMMSKAKSMYSCASGKI